MKTLLSPLLLFCLPAIPATFCQAAFSPSIVGADARWVVHLDLNTFRNTAPGKKILDDIKANQPKFASGAIKVDPQKVLAAIGSVTAYGTNFSKDPKAIDGTLIIVGTPELQKIAQGIIAETSVSSPDKITEIKDLPFEAYLVNGDTIIGLPKEPIILVGKSKPYLQRAYDVYNGKAPSIAKSPSALSAMIPKDPNAYFLAASVIPSREIFPENAPHARVLQMANSGSIAIADDNTKTYASIQLTSATEDLSDKLSKILQGIAAGLSLSETDDHQLEEFAKSVTVERRDKTVVVSISYSSDRVSQMIETVHKAQPHVHSDAPAAVDTEKTISKWNADQHLGTETLGAASLATQTIEHVKLKTGTTIILTGARNFDGGGKDLARFDYVEVASPASTLHFEAERMKLSGYHAATAPYASGGKVVELNNKMGSARFEFPGEDGEYTIKIRYVDDPSGSASMSVKLQDPEPAPHD